MKRSVNKGHRVKFISAAILAAVIIALIIWMCERPSATPTIILATTTSTQDSGLLDILIPIFEKQTGYFVKTIAVGSGLAITMGRRGDVDVLLVHSPDDEARFMEEGLGLNRRRVMHNDFVVVGPLNDPAGIRGMTSSTETFQRLASAQALFISRGDRSGTHATERSIWKKAGINPEGGRWYQETGLGMGQSLQIASEKGAYTLSDRGTYLALKRNIRLDVMVEGGPSLLNVYHVIEVHSGRSPRVNANGARAFADFMVSNQAQDIISAFGMETYGEPIFFADAVLSSARP